MSLPSWLSACVVVLLLGCGSRTGVGSFEAIDGGARPTDARVLDARADSSTRRDAGLRCDPSRMVTIPRGLPIEVGAYFDTASVCVRDAAAAREVERVAPRVQCDASSGCRGGGILCVWRGLVGDPPGTGAPATIDAEELAQACAITTLGDSVGSLTFTLFVD